MWKGSAANADVLTLIRKIVQEIIKNDGIEQVPDKEVQTKYGLDDFPTEYVEEVIERSLHRRGK